jgi:tetratricopeptide (TPR) repeat protein
VLPEEKLEILLHTTNWDVLEALLTMEEFRSVDIYNLINRQLLVVKDENLKEILRIFRQLYDWVLNGEGNDAFVRMRNNFEGSAIYEWRGRVYLASNGYSAALAQFNRSIEIDDNNPSSHVNRGWTFRGIGNYTTAIEDFDTALNAEPAFHDAYLGRGVCHFETGNYGLSLSDLTNAIKNNKNSVYAFQWRGTLHLYMGDAVTALEDINLSIKLDSNNLSHYYWRGLIYLKSGDFKKGLADFTRVIENDVPYSLSVSYAFLWRGMCHIFLGKQKYGQGDWEVAIDMSKKIINPVRNSLLQGLYHLMLKEFEQSKAMYTNVLTMRYVPHVLITQANHIQLISELYEENSIDGLSKWLRGEIDARLGNIITARG